MNLAIVTVSGPPGVGKTTLVRALSLRRKFRLLPSITTRSRRPCEMEFSTHSHVSFERYAQMLELDEIVLSDEFEGNLYGNLRSDLLMAAESNDIWLADFSARVVRSLEKSKFSPIAAVLMSAPVDVCVQRMKQRGDKMRQVMAREQMHSWEEVRCAKIEMSNMNSSRIDATVTKAEVRDAAFSFIESAILSATISASTVKKDISEGGKWSRR